MKMESWNKWGTAKELLKSGGSYQDLKNSYVIFIMEKDPFGENLMWYTVTTDIKELPEITYQDGNATIYLYTRGTDNKDNQKLSELLHYIEDSRLDNVTNQEIAEIHTIISEIKADEAVRSGYMKSWEIEEMIRQEAHAEGHSEGRAEGEHRPLSLMQKLILDGRTKDVESITANSACLEELYEEYHL